MINHPCILSIIVIETYFIGGTQRQFSENICSENDLRSRMFGTFVVKFLACLPLLGFKNTATNQNASSNETANERLSNSGQPIKTTITS